MSIQLVRAAMSIVSRIDSSPRGGQQNKSDGGLEFWQHGSGGRGVRGSRCGRGRVKNKNKTLEDLDNQLGAQNAEMNQS